MRRIITILCLSVSASGFAQWNISNPPHTYYNTGNVGIGTATPLYSLDVSGTARISTILFSNQLAAKNIQLLNNSDYQFRVQSTYGVVDMGAKNSNYAHFHTDRPKFYFDKELAVNSGMIGSYNEDLQLRTDGTTRIFVRNDNGNVGIGTTSPTDKFSVHNTFLVRQDGVVRWGNAGDYGILTWDVGRAMIGGQANQGLALFADGSEKMRILTNGNVGIGTNTPQATLDLFKDNATLFVRDPRDNAEASSTLQLQTGGQVQRFKFYWNDRFAIDSGEGTTEQLTIKRNGNVGIGTTDVRGKLGIYNSSIFNTDMSPVGQDNIILQGTDPGNGGYFGGITWLTGERRRASIAATRENDDSDYVGLAFFTKGTDGVGPMYESMRITRSGNVGIGTSSPQYNLDVIGNASISGGLDLEGVANFNGGRLSHSGNIPNDNNAVFVNTAEGGYGIYSKGGLNTRYAFHFENQAGTSIIYGRGDGNVGIGTTTPDAKLAVKGHIHTQEVRVDLEGAMAPDYVFEETYNLPTLASTEAYIKQHKHLPEIPSACEMEENGLNLKEMNLLLLKKIEELTLHVIEQNKKIEKHQKELEELKKK